MAEGEQYEIQVNFFVTGEDSDLDAQQKVEELIDDGIGRNLDNTVVTYEIGIVPYQGPEL